MGIAEFGVVIVGGRSGQQDQLAARAQLLLRENLQLAPDALALVTGMHRNIRQIAGIVEIRQRPRHTHQPVAVPRRYRQVGILEHAFHAGAIFNRPALAQRGGIEQFDKLVDRDGGVDFELDIHAYRSLCSCQITGLSGW